tara:strand:- start:1949 stop:3991 length:2043 start_codon:yes stop_codon:yes gene_type:complete
MKRKLFSAMLTGTLLATPATALAETIRIGETTALIPEAGLATEQVVDGGNGNVNFPYANFKAIATIGEVGDNGLALTGYPDGQAAYLLDNDTIRVIYQSESYATMGKAPVPETYNWVMENGVTFSGSHIHTIDYDRAKFADFLNNGESAEGMVKGSGKLFNRIYNVFGDEVVRGGVWGNQALPDQTIVPFLPKYQLTNADFFLQSFCGSWYEQANKYGDGIGLADDVWLTAEEWEIGRMFTGSKKTGGKESAKTMGLASVVVDVKNQVAYTAPALGQTGYEKLMPINPQHKDYVVIVGAGYNHNQEPAPLKIYVGMKDRLADGSEIDYSTANERDAFLARNGMLYGRIYGFAMPTESYAALGLEANPAAKMMDEYLQNADAPNTFEGRFYPTSYQWGGWDNPVAVKDTEMMLWEQAGEQPDGYTFFNGDSKAEHPAVDPDITRTRYVQNMTNKGGILGFDFGNIGAALDAANGDLPEYLDASGIRVVAAVDGALTLKTGGEGVVKGGSAAIHVEKNKAAMVAPDGLYWTKHADGSFLIVDEDSGNDFGERKYVLPINESDMTLSEANTGYLLGLAGGKHSSRYQAGASALGGAFSKATTSEFSGSWNVTALTAKKGPFGVFGFYSADELAGTGEQKIIQGINTEDQLFIGVVQARGESGGAVAEKGADAGGQVFQFNFKF